MEIQSLYHFPTLKSQVSDSQISFETQGENPIFNLSNVPAFQDESPGSPTI